MLIEFTCSNHFSILDPVTLSFVASSDKKRIEQTYPCNKMRVLSSAIIYGANGSGKSNLLTALRCMQSLVLENMGFRPNVTVLKIPHKLAGKDRDSEYKINFVKNGFPYSYGYVLGSEGVKHEFLYTYPNGRKTKVFDRVGEVVTFGSKYKKEDFSAARKALRPNRLFLTCASDLCNVQECLETCSFICDDLVFCMSNRQRIVTTNYTGGQGAPHEEFWEDYSLRRIKEDESVRKQVLSLMHSFGYPLEDIEVESKTLSSADFPPIFTEDAITRMQKEKIQTIRAKMNWGQFVTSLSSEESSGIRKLCWFLVPFLDAFKEGKVLICDELDNHLHESVVSRLIEIINQHNDNEHFPQFLLTAHSSSLLKSQLFRRDQIWFTELRPEDRSTDLYSLAEIKDVRADESFQNGYLSGRYGAIPALNYDFRFPTEGAE